MTSDSSIDRVTPMRDLMGLDVAHSAVRDIQRVMQRFEPGLKVDGIPGPKTQAAWERLQRNSIVTTGSDWFEAKASSFADPADLAAFKHCKAEGLTDQQCFKIGDNGIGQFGANTAQEHTPMVAIHEEDMLARWGSVEAAAHQLVEVFIAPGRSVIAAVEDRLGMKGRIDLNPACAVVLGLKPPFLVPCMWRLAAKTDDGPSRTNTDAGKATKA